MCISSRKTKMYKERNHMRVVGMRKIKYGALFGTSIPIRSQTSIVAFPGGNWPVALIGFLEKIHV